MVLLNGTGVKQHRDAGVSYAGDHPNHFYGIVIQGFCFSFMAVIGGSGERKLDRDVDAEQSANCFKESW